MSYLILIYLADLFEGLKLLSIVLAICSGFALFVSLIDSETANIRKVATIVFCIFCFLSVASPGKETLYAAIGLQAAQDISSEVKQSEIFKKTIKIINKKLDEELKE